MNPYLVFLELALSGGVMTFDSYAPVVHQLAIIDGLSFNAHPTGISIVAFNEPWA